MYNKNYCSTAQNSSFWKRFLVRLLCKRKLVEKKWVWQQLGYFSRWKINLQQRGSASHLPPKTVVKPLIQKLLRSLFLSAFWHGQPGVHTGSVCARVLVWLNIEKKKKKIPSVQQGDLLGTKHADAWSASEAKRECGRSRPLALPAGVGGKDNMEAAASQKPQPS